MSERPYTLLSCGMSIDGFLGSATPRRLALSNEADFDRVDAVRASCDAILVGAATVRCDNPRLLVRSKTRRDERAARGLGDVLIARGILLSLGRRVPKKLGWVPFADPIYDTFAFINRRGARLSPAAREFMALAEERMQGLADELRTTPPRRRKPGA